ASGKGDAPARTFSRLGRRLIRDGGGGGVASAADLSPMIDVLVPFAPIKNEPVHMKLAVRQDLGLPFARASLEDSGLRHRPSPVFPPVIGEMAVPAESKPVAVVPADF